MLCPRSQSSSSKGAEDWLSGTLQDAIQLKYLVLRHCRLEQALSTLSGLVRLTELDMDNNMLQELPASITQLTNLQEIHLDLNSFICIPTVLEEMTHLKVLDISNDTLRSEPADAMQVTRPLSFLANFPALMSVTMSGEWNALSMFHLGMGQAALDKAFKHRLPHDKPVLIFL